MSIAAFDHPFLSGLVGDDEIAALLGTEADLAAMLSFETALAGTCASHGVIPEAASSEIAAACARFRPDMDALRIATGRDGVVVPELVRQLRETAGDHAKPHVHFGATSQDVVDTSVMLRLRQVCMVFEDRLSALVTGFDRLSKSFGDEPLTGHTRMQPALQITARDRIRTWQAPLARHAGRLGLLIEQGFALQLGGAAGTSEKFGDKAADIRRDLAAALSLVDAQQYQSQRDRFVDIAGLMAMITGSLGKFGQDVALMAQAGTEIELTGGGRSSAMAHKQNPVAAEVLVTLARFNAVQSGGMQQAMIHEQERSGAAWTLEWLILPQMAMATGAALRLSAELLANIRHIGKSGEDA